MRIELLNTAVVVVAQEHNPTILHPAFLTSQGIIPEDWKLAEAPVCTPAFSVAKYENGVSFTVDSNRFLVAEERPSGNPAESGISGLAVSYVERLPHVRYRSLGVNFAGYCLQQSPERLLMERFLKAGPWNAGNHPMKAMGARFVYHVDQAILRVGIDGGQVQLGEESREAVLVSGNFHSELPGGESVESLRTLIDRWPNRLDAFRSLARAILALED